MGPEITLVAVFLISLSILKIRRGKYEFALSGRIAMSAMLVMTSIGHFLFAKGMSMIMPDFIPYKVELVYFTGVLEIAAAIGLCLPRFRRTTAWLLIVFFILLLPANIYGAIKHVDIQKATFDGPGLDYLWFRIPLQILFIVWVYLSSIKKSTGKRKIAAINRGEVSPPSGGRELYT